MTEISFQEMFSMKNACSPFFGRGHLLSSLEIPEHKVGASKQVS